MNDSDLDPMRVAPCKICGWSVEPGTDWGFLSDEMTYERCVDGCTHVHGQRRCYSCTRDWYRVGMDSSWDVDGCGKEDCPQCAPLGILANEYDSLAKRMQEIQAVFKASGYTWPAVNHLASERAR